MQSTSGINPFQKSGLIDFLSNRCNTTVMLFVSKGSEVTGVLEVVAEETLVLADRGDGMRVEVATDLSGDHLVRFGTAQKKHAIQISDILIQFPFYLLFFSIFWIALTLHN